jgi:hypothetical protein
VSESSATITGAFGMFDTACSIISSDVADDADSLHRSTIVCAERLLAFFFAQGAHCARQGRQGSASLRTGASVQRQSDSVA